MPKDLFLTLLVIVILLCTANLSQSEDAYTSFVSSISMLKAETYLVGPVWISALRSNEDPSKWTYTMYTPFEDVYRIKILMIFFNDNKKTHQVCMKIFDGPMETQKLYNGELKTNIKHTHIGFSALIEK